MYPSFTSSQSYCIVSYCISSLNTIIEIFDTSRLNKPHLEVF